MENTISYLFPKLGISKLTYIRFFPELIFGIEGTKFRVGIKQSYFNNLIFALK